ncbi:MAG TPA: 1-phosphofructokinase [Herpetosiphonaceae bacterium]|nr:1-phosphofructokinase [Herpetosiphonaceae bacterium]
MNDKPAARHFDAVTVTLNPAIDRTVTIPNFAAGIVNRVEDMVSTAGGKGVNVASTLADDGHTVAVTGFLGRDNPGVFEALFTRKQIEDRFVRIAGQTRVGIKIVDPVQQQTTDINFPGQAPLPADLDALRERLAALDGRWFVLAGSLPPAVDVTIYRDLVATLQARGGSVLLDTSGEALRYAVEAVPRIIKPNIHELEVLTGETLAGRREVIAAARKLLARGIEMVAVSMGKEGACFVTAETVVTAQPPDVVVRSTVGAGDAMVAGIIAGQLRRLPLDICARLATAFSLDAITRIGGDLRSAAEIERLMARVGVDELQA